MGMTIDKLLDDFEKGNLSRRQLVQGLLLLALPATGYASPAASQADAPGAIIPTRSMNHVHIGVTDIDRSAKFYSTVFGARVRARRAPDIVLMMFPHSTSAAPFHMSITRGEKNRPGIDGSLPGAYTHMAFGVDFDNNQHLPERIAERVMKAFPDTQVPTANQDGKGTPVQKGLAKRNYMYIFDPDGLAIQLIDTRFEPSNSVG